MNNGGLVSASYFTRGQCSKRAWQIYEYMMAQNLQDIKASGVWFLQDQDSWKNLRWNFQVRCVSKSFPLYCNCRSLQYGGISGHSLFSAHLRYIPWYQYPSVVSWPLNHPRHFSWSTFSTANQRPINSPDGRVQPCKMRMFGPHTRDVTMQNFTFQHVSPERSKNMSAKVSCASESL